MDANSESAERARRENAMIRRLDRIREEKRHAAKESARRARRAHVLNVNNVLIMDILVSVILFLADEWGE